MSDIFDILLILKDNNGHYWELKFDNYFLSGFDEFPIAACLKKSNRITKEELNKKIKRL